VSPAGTLNAVLRLTRTGKIVSGVLGLLFVLFVYMTFIKSDPAPVGPDPALLQPASIPKGFSFPLADRQLEEFQARSAPNRSRLDVCQFTSGYVQSRGVPIQFEALLAPNARQNPYFHVDRRSGREYWPAYYVDPDPRGLATAQAAAAGDTTNLNACDKDSAGQAIPLLLAFDAGQKPPGDLLRIDGIVWWDSLAANPGQRSTPAGASTTDAPMVRVGHAEQAFSAQLERPAFKKRVLNMAFRRGGVVLRLGRIEFATGQTRLWVELYNKTDVPVPNWNGGASATLRQDGGASVTAGNSDQGAGADQATSTDVLPSEDIPAKGGGSLRGYITFPEVDPNRTLFLNLPEINTRSQATGAAPITIRLDPKLNRPVS
jgi:hypothetical protein